MTVDKSSTNEARASGGHWVVWFFLLTYAVTWSCFVAVACDVTPAKGGAGQTVLLLGTIAPSLVALLLTWLAEGAGGTRPLLRGLARWRVGWGWYAFAFVFIAALKLLAAVLVRVALGAWPRFGTEPLWVLPVAVLLSTPVQAGEEIGWRGYALPRMASRIGWGPASVVLGIIWASWHLPLFFVAAADTYQQSFLIYALQVTAISVTMAWVYAQTGRSLLLVMVLHAAVNNTKDIVPSTLPVGAGVFTLAATPMAWTTVALLWICAAYLLTRMPRGEK